MCERVWRSAEGAHRIIANLFRAKLANINHVRLLRQGDGLEIGSNYTRNVYVQFRIVGHLDHLYRTHTHTHTQSYKYVQLIHFAIEMNVGHLK